MVATTSAPRTGSSSGSPSRPVAGPRRRRRVPVALVVTGVVAAVLFVLPVVMVAVGAFRSAAPGASGAHWTLGPLVDLYSDSAAWRVLGDSALFAVVVSLVSTLVAAYLAWLAVRTDTPLRGLLTPMMLVVLVMPHLFFAVSWGLLGDSTTGGINEVVRLITGSEASPVDVHTWPGIVFVASLKSVALKYLLLIGPMAAMDRSQEEAALVAGASKSRTFVSVTLPALAPAMTGAFVLGVVVALEYFDIPLILGGGTGIRVFSTEVYEHLFERTPPEYAQASALALGAMVLLVVLLVVQSRLLGGRQYATVRGKTSRRGTWRLGRWRWVGSTVVVLFGLLALVLPVGQLVVVSLLPFVGVYRQLGPENYQTVLADPTVVQAIWSTVELAVAGGAGAVLVAVAITYVVRHHRGLPGRLLGVAVWLPWSVPGTALALGMLWAYLSIPGLRSIYGTPLLVLLGLLVAATPLAMRTVEPGVGQVSRDLEEAARIAGAGRPRAFGDAVLRLVTPSLLAGGVLAGILVAGNLVVPVMLGSTQSQTLPALILSKYQAGRVPEAASLLCLLLAGIVVVSLAAAVLLRLVRHLRSRTDRTTTAAARAAAPTTSPGTPLTPADLPTAAAPASSATPHETEELPRVGH